MTIFPVIDVERSTPPSSLLTLLRFPFINFHSLMNIGGRTFQAEETATTYKGPAVGMRLLCSRDNKKAGVARATRVSEER